MRQFFLTALGVLTTTFTLAQVSPNAEPTNDKQRDLLGRGTLNVGVNVSAGYGGYVGLNGRVVPRLQYFLKDGWSVALEGRYETNGNQYQYAGAGVSTRYYFVRDRRLALFGQAGIAYGQGLSRFPLYNLGGLDPLLPIPYQERRTRTVQSAVGLGVHYRVARRWSLEGVIERTLTRNIGLSTNSRWQGSVGVNFRLSK